jgi:REP element-mobilizing transposase RayT
MKTDVGQAVPPADAQYLRHLPHLHPSNTYLFLTWRLKGSLPSSKTNPYLTPGQAFAAADRIEDRRTDGPLWLKDPAVAQVVSQAILAGDRERHFYDLYAWVVMPNHVHILILPKVAVPVLTRWLKGSTARFANQILNRTGQPFWQSESYDHYLRKSNQLNTTIDYIEQNPVSAGLAPSAERWPWSSAGWQAQPPALHQ